VNSVFLQWLQSCAAMVLGYQVGPYPQFEKMIGRTGAGQDKVKFTFMLPVVQSCEQYI